MNELVAFLRARYNEDEQVARAADAGRWLPEDKGVTFEWRADDFHEGEAQARLLADTRANLEHIANWHPARVLAEVDAKIRVLDHAEAWFGASFATTPDGWSSDTATAYRMAMGWTLRLLAQPYADHPDYREEWTP